MSVMTRSGNVMLTGACVLVLAMPSIAVDDSVSNGPVPGAWTRPGAEWLVRVEQYSRSGWAGYSDPKMAEEARKPRVQYEFHMRITVLKPRSEGDERIARIRFAPMDDAPEFMQGTVRVLELVAGTGYAIGTRDDEKPIVLRGAGPVGREHGLFSNTYGFPTAWIVTAADLAQIPTRTEDHSVIDKTSHSLIKKLRPTVTADGKQPALEIEVAYSWLDAAPSKRIVQTWVPGEGWWRSFTRYIQGHIDLEATLVDRKGE